jgi:hypothetical protein
LSTFQAIERRERAADSHVESHRFLKRTPGEEFRSLGMSQIGRVTGNQTSLPRFRFGAHATENADSGITDAVQNDPNQRETQTMQDEEQRDLPNGAPTQDVPGGGTGGGGDICGKPVSMTKITSGAFRDKLTMDDYYPDLVGKGAWAHGGSAGPFDTGSRVGSNIQLIGKIRIPCDPAKFSLAQTVTYTKAIFNGVHLPKEGVAQDDIAKSGRDFAHAPSRQERSDDISMADPPSTEYSSGATSLASDIEFDRSFTTSLVGPAGKESADWSTSIKVDQGKVVRNTIS